MVEVMFYLGKMGNYFIFQGETTSYIDSNLSINYGLTSDNNLSISYYLHNGQFTEYTFRKKIPQANTLVFLLIFSSFYYFFQRHYYHIEKVQYFN